MHASYDDIGRGYAHARRADRHIAAALIAALGDARSVVNVGAGTGSYESVHRRVIAVEPSAVMIAQRPPGAAAVVRAAAEALPFRAGAFDAALAVLTVHHWTDRSSGLAECVRVAARRVVLLTWDPASEGFWLAREYFPEIMPADRRRFPTLDELARELGPLRVAPLPIPADCQDGFLGAFWRRPEAYLDPAVRAGMSALARLGSDDARLARLRADLDSGAWRSRHTELLERDTLEMGYRIVIAELANTPTVP